ncbi:hypothetical protein T440DRAFT_290785 [Plenodomus tracheiphilus IPT5]|uniref:DUF7703 domain-containing protein n=1 Tax=Plenodomus tracheiphilus IPT5 TaxID=1408161 RepID=A0A6A7BF01_9PLEO|nr:hypothetical protein T440DRAFT_290785 [Plenodomus tracheiphilus IPT5]
MAFINGSLAIGPLGSTLEVVTFVALTGMAWFNGAELLCTIFLTFKIWSGKYFYCLVTATFGVLIYQINVFLMIFSTHLNAHGIIACVGIGWSAMVTGQSLVLWSRLHLVCRNEWHLRIILYMIVINGVSMHGPQFVFSLLAVKNNATDPTYKPFEIMEKIAVAILTTQEMIISIVYLISAVRILRFSESVQRKGNRRRIKLLFLANVAIICIDICTVTLEYMAFWGLWCSFKGFGYSVKLKIEFAILFQLRDSVKGSRNMESYDIHISSKPSGVLLRGGSDLKVGQPSRLSTKRHTFEQIVEARHIQKTTEINVRHDRCNSVAHHTERLSVDQRGNAPSTTSEPSSEIEFATRAIEPWY